jgi:signal transduction histidine kinase
LTVGSLLVDGISNGSALPLAFYAGLGSLAVAVGFFLLAGRIVDALFPRRSLSRTVATLLVFAGSEITRTLLFSVVLLRYGLELELMLVHRFIAGGLTGMLVIGIVSLVVNDRSAFRKEHSFLASRRAELARELEYLNNSIDSFMDTLRENVRQSVEAALQPILATLASSYTAKDVVTDIVRVSEDVVRPLSEQVANALPDNPDEAPERRTVSARELFQLTTLTHPFQPMGMTVVVFLLFFSASIFLVRAPYGVIVLATSMVMIWLSHYVGNRFVQPHLHRWPTLTRLVVISALYMSGFVVAIIGILFSRGEGTTIDRIPTLLYTLGVLLAISWGVAIIRALRAGRQQVLQNLAAITRELARVRATGEVRLRRERQRLAATVHGDIQSTLMATALRLQHPGFTRSDVPGIIEEAQQKISESLNRVQQDTVPATLPEVKDAIDSFWQGMLTITWEDDSAVAKSLARDRDLAETVWQVVREAAGNAVKHGQASDLEVTLRLDGPGTHVCVAVSDNGETPPEPSRTGGGTRLFHAVSDNFDIRREGNRTVVTLSIPLADTAQPAPVL